MTQAQLWTPARRRGTSVRALLPRVVLLGVLIAILARVAHIAIAWRDPGLFSYIGYDFGNLWAQAWVFTTLGMARAYDLSTVSSVATPILDFYRDQIGHASGNPPLEVLPGPYPPPVILFLAPTTLIAPYWAFALWIGLNLSALGYVSWGLARRFANHRLLVLLVPISFYPLTEALLLGQPTVLLLFALWQGYTNLERGRDFRAGLWLGLILIKPQFLVALGLVLLLKRRWNTVFGVAVVGVLLVASSAILLGMQGLQTYLSVFGMFAGFRITYPGVLPELGISWRALLLNVLPESIGEQEGTLLTLLLSVSSLALLPLLWRGRWDVTQPQFGVRVFGTMVIAMLVAYHNHLHGATMLVVPAIVAFGRAAPLLRWVLWAALFTHPVLFVLSRALNLPIRISVAYIVLMLFALTIMLLGELRWPAGAVSRLLLQRSQRPAL